MILRFYNIITLILINIFIFAQENGYVQYKDTNFAYINASRNIIFEYIQNEQYDEAKQLAKIMDYTYQLTDYLTFYPIERWLLAYWIKDYGLILKQAVQFDSLKKANSYKIYPPIDIFSENIKNYSFLNQNKILQNIGSSDLSGETLDFLTLTLNYLFYDEESEIISQSFLNRESDRFLATYPTSVYQDFVKQKIRYKLKETSNNFGFCFYTGYVANFGQLGNYFKNTAPIALGFDFYHKNFLTALQFQVGVASEIKNEFMHDGIWAQEMKLNFYQPELLLGYNVYSNLKSSLKPFVSFGIRGYLPSKYEIENIPGADSIQYSIGPKFTCTLGLNYDMALLKSSEMVWGKKVNSYWHARFQLGASYPTLYLENDLFRGAIVYFLIGISSNTKITKREL